MLQNFSIKSIFDFHTHVESWERGEARMKARIWICPDCGKLYLTLIPRQRQGHSCHCGHMFDDRDIG